MSMCGRSESRSCIGDEFRISSSPSTSIRIRRPATARSSIPCPSAAATRRTIRASPMIAITCGPAGLDTNKIFIFDVAIRIRPSQRLRPDDRRLRRAKSGGIVGPHTTYALPGRMLVTGLVERQGPRRPHGNGRNTPTAVSTSQRTGCRQTKTLNGAKKVRPVRRRLRLRRAGRCRGVTLWSRRRLPAGTTT